MFDRRRAPRFAAGLEAVVTAPLRPRIPVLVTDISTHGAMLKFSRPEYLPSGFFVTLGSFTTRCTIRHRDGAKIGVEFETEYDWSHEGAPTYAAMLSPGQRHVWEPRISQL